MVTKQNDRGAKMNKAILGAAVALVIAMPATAQAQCTYRTEKTPSREYFAKPLAGPTPNGGYFVKRGNRIRVWRPDGTFGGTVVEHAKTVCLHRSRR
jgi:hypothetical protein